VNSVLKQKFLLATLVVAGCTSPQSSHESLNGALWVQTSVEYKVAAVQSFTAARSSTVKALNDTSWSAALEQTGEYQNLPPAVIVDVDETVLDNSPFQARLINKGIGFDLDLWEAWVNESTAIAIPGAKEFITFLKQKNVKVFYVTNRALENPTVKNIKQVLDPQVSAEDVLCKNEKTGWGSDKTSRRKEIAQNYRIILLVGDNYNDFHFPGEVGPEERIKKAKTFQDYWGSKWIIVSNPLYGDWEASLYNYDYSMSHENKLKAKYEYLKN